MIYNSLFNIFLSTFNKLKILISMYDII